MANSIPAFWVLVMCAKHPMEKLRGLNRRHQVKAKKNCNFTASFPMIYSKNTYLAIFFAHVAIADFAPQRYNMSHGSELDIMSSFRSITSRKLAWLLSSLSSFPSLCSATVLEGGRHRDTTERPRNEKFCAFINRRYKSRYFDSGRP